MFSTAVVCRSRHDIFTYSLLEYIRFFHNGKALCRPVCTNSNKTGHTLQRFPNEANLKQQWVKFVQAKRADFVEPFKHSVVFSSHFLPIVKKGFMVEMGLQKEKKTSSWCCTDDSGPARGKLGKKRPTHLADGEDSDVADRTKKRPRKISALQKLEVNRISTKLIYTETFSIYWKIIGRPVSQEPALSPINMIKTLAFLNLCMSLKHVLKKENSLTSVFNSIWNFVGST